MRCIVLAGSEKAFAAGADVSELAALSAPELYTGRRIERWDAIRRMRTPLVAAVSGFCLGGGCELALACDLIVASETAVFAQPETGLGIIPGAGGTQRLRAPLARRSRWTWSSPAGGSPPPRRSPPAWSRGSSPAGALARRGAERSPTEIAAKAPIAQRLERPRRSTARSRHPSRSGLDYERRSLELALASEDAREGLTAFVEKREPRFEGR